MHHHETRVVPYTAEQMFDLVADVARYPEFLPWVTAARIRTRDQDTFVADVLVGFKSFRERFTSRVVLNRAKRAIIAEYLEVPFQAPHQQMALRTARRRRLHDRFRHRFRV
jgi:coenzyme Q-binding protein COQ10